MARTVRVDIPRRNPDELETLGDTILTRHDELGNNSPLLNFVDTALLQSQLTVSTDKRALSRSRDADGQADTQAADTAWGIEEGQNIQTAGTVYHLTGLIRDRLLFVYDGPEEELSKWGFNVVVSEKGGTKTVSVEIPIGTLDTMERLVNNIIEKHNELGNSSPLKDVIDMVLYESQNQLAISKRKSARKAHAEAQATMQLANIALGIAKGQKSTTKGTVYYLITRVRDHLLLVHDGTEEELSTYGFNVVISEAGTGGGTPPTPIEKIIITMSTVQNPADKVTLGFKGEAGKLVKTVFGDGNIKSITMDGINYILVGNTYISNGNYTVASEVEIATLDGIIAAGIFLTAVLHPDGLDAEEYDYSNNDLTSIFFLPTNTKAKKIDVSGNNLDQQSMDTMMMTANGWGTDNGYIKADGGTNAIPSGQGIAAMNQLIARGWTVITN